VALAVGSLFEVRDHVRRSVVGRVLVQQRQMPLPNAFSARKLGVPQISTERRISMSKSAKKHLLQ
jgi:hypothetical protein